MAVEKVVSFQLSVLSKRLWRVAACIILLLSCACSAKAGAISRIALLAPFEGRYREIGYNALYAARLAFRDFADSHIELLAVDDGGRSATAAARARALSQDPLVKAVVILGYAATDAETLRAFSDVPVLVVGDWGAQPETDRVFVLANPQLNAMLTVDTRAEVTDAARLEAPLSGGDVFALEQFAHLRPSVDGVRILSSGSLPDATFTERYQQMGLFVPAPGLLATLTYDAFGMVLSALDAADANITPTLAAQSYDAINGAVRFEGGYWANAPFNQYEYDRDCIRRGGEMCLVPVNSDNRNTP